LKFECGGDDLYAPDAKQVRPFSMLTDTTIRKTKARRLADGGGLYLLDHLWRYKYRFQGKEKLMSFGKYPDVPLVTARALHAAARQLLASGVDPMAARKAERNGNTPESELTFKTLGGLWHTHWKKGKSDQHVNSSKRRLEANVYPTLGSRRPENIEPLDLVAMVKTIEARGVEDLAKRALGNCGQIFRYGIAHGLCKRNPAAEIKPGDVLQAHSAVNLARIEAAQLPKLLRAIEVYRGSVLTRLACKLMALTFVRTSELIGARWEEFDIPTRRWNIPAARMKMKTPHIVPLSDRTIQTLALISIAGNPHQSVYLFPGERGKATMSNNTILFALRRMGYGGVMTGHGFRGLASTLLHEQGWPHEHIEIQLAHAPRNTVSAAYNHALYLEPRAKMMQAWGDYLEGQLRGEHDNT
jgi:integrase